MKKTVQKTTLEKNEQKQKTNKEEFTLRPMNVKTDYEELIPFYDKIFEKELQAKGGSVKALLDETKAMMPFFKFIGLFSKNFRHVFDGFVFENEQGAIISTLNIGFSGNYWEIAMVATDPKYRRLGLARKLVEKALEHAKKHGAKMCILEVLEENKPAYELYKNMGFQHFDTQMKLKLEPGKISSTVNDELPEGYSIKERKMDKRTSLAMYELEVLATPQEVRDFLPVNKLKYQKPVLLRVIRPIVKLFIKSKTRRWTVQYENEIVGNLFADLGRSKEDCHKLEVIVDHAHSEKIDKPLMNFVLKYIKDNANYDINIVTTMRKTDDQQLKVLRDLGFIIFETDHILGLKFNDK